MTDYLVTVTCPLSQLYTINAALDWARFRAICNHEADDTAEFAHAYDLSFALCVNGRMIGEPLTDAESPQTQETALSEFVPF